MENSERLGRQAQPGIEPDAFRLPVLSAEPLSHWWSDKSMSNCCMLNKSFQIQAKVNEYEFLAVS